MVTNFLGIDGVFDEVIQRTKQGLYNFNESSITAETSDADFIASLSSTLASLGNMRTYGVKLKNLVAIVFESYKNKKTPVNHADCLFNVCNTWIQVISKTEFSPAHKETLQKTLKNYILEQITKNFSDVPILSEINTLEKLEASLKQNSIETAESPEPKARRVETAPPSVEKPYSRWTGTFLSAQHSHTATTSTSCDHGSSIPKSDQDAEAIGEESDFETVAPSDKLFDLTTAVVPNIERWKDNATTCEPLMQFAKNEEMPRKIFNAVTLHLLITEGIQDVKNKENRDRLIALWGDASKSLKDTEQSSEKRKKEYAKLCHEQGQNLPNEEEMMKRCLMEADMAKLRIDGVKYDIILDAIICCAFYDKENFPEFILELYEQSKGATEEINDILLAKIASRMVNVYWRFRYVDQEGLQQAQYCRALIHSFNASNLFGELHEKFLAACKNIAMYRDGKSAYVHIHEELIASNPMIEVGGKFRPLL